MMKIVYLLAGAVFGFILHQSRITDYTTIVNMFRLKDLHLMGVMGAAIGTAALGLFFLRRAGRPAVLGGAIEIRPKPMKKGIFLAGLVFGAGWALSGA